MATPTTLPATFVAGNVLTAAQMNDLRGAFRIMQVVSTFKDDTFTINSSTFTDVTGLSVAITPAFTTSKVLIMVTMSTSSNWNTGNMQTRLMRGTTAIAIGAAAGSRTQASTVTAGGNDFTGQTVAITYLDSPATTSSTTYKMQIRHNTAGLGYVNRQMNDTDNAQQARTASTITVFEVSA